MDATDIDEMARHYAIAALWSSTDDRCTREGMREGERCADDPERETSDYCGACRWGGEPLDATFDVDDIDAETMAEFRADCAAFYESCAEDLAEMSPEQAGHDFWLTRNGHGVGFWARDLGARGDRLTEVAKPYGDVYLYADENGVHQ